MKCLRFIPVLVLLIITVACSSEKPNDLIAEDSYIEIMAELHIVRAIYNQDSDGQQRDELVIKIFDQHKVTSEQFDRSNDFYQKDLIKQRDRLRKSRDLVQEEFTRLNTKLISSD